MVSRWAKFWLLHVCRWCQALSGSYFLNGLTITAKQYWTDGWWWWWWYQSLTAHQHQTQQTTCSRWYDHEWLKADYKPESSIHINTKRVIQCQNRCKLHHKSKQSSPEKNAMVKQVQSPRQKSKNCTVWEHSLSGKVWTKYPTRLDTQGAPRWGCSQIVVKYHCINW